MTPTTRAGAALVLASALPLLVSGQAQAATRVAAAGSGAPPGYLRVVGAPGDAPSGALDTGAETACPPGTVVWGGGAALTGGIPSAGTDLNTSVPGGSGWRARFNNTSGRTVQFRVDAVCAAEPAGYTVRFATADNPPGQLSGALAVCPAGTVLLSGGTLSTADTADVLVVNAFPRSTTAFRSVVWNGSPVAHRLTSFAVCAARPPRYALISQRSTATGPTTIASGAQCPTGTVATGRGVKVVGPRPEIAIGASLAEPATQWLSEVVDTVPGPVRTTTYALCAGTR